MLQDISPHIYHNPMSFLPPSAGDLVLAYTEGGVLARREAELLQLPTVSQCPNVSGWTYAFSIDDVRYYLPQEVPQVPTFSPVSNYRANGPRETAFACAVGESLSRWYAGNRFCGACGTPLAHSTLERAMVCPACGRTIYPKICPAVIVAVCHNDQLLLTKSPGAASGAMPWWLASTKSAKPLNRPSSARSWRRRDFWSITCGFTNPSPGWYRTACCLASLPTWPDRTSSASRKMNWPKPGGSPGQSFPQITPQTA